MNWTTAAALGGGVRPLLVGVGTLRELNCAAHTRNRRQWPFPNRFDGFLIEFSAPSLDLTGFHPFGLGFNGFHWVLLGFIHVSTVLRGLIGFSFVGIGLNRLHWSSFGLKEFYYWVLLGFIDIDSVLRDFKGFDSV